MATLSRPDGVEIHWGERGEGPPVVLANQVIGFPGVFEALIADLATDHRVVFYDLRGNGKSSRQGPYDFDTDTGDLEAVIEAAGPPAVLIGLADGCNRAVKLAARRPELVAAVVAPGGNPLGRKAYEGLDALAGSDSVRAAVLEHLRNDYRGALRALLTDFNPQMSDEEVRERIDATVAYSPHDSALPRLLEFVDDDSHEEALAVGGKLWILWHGDNEWFPASGIPRTRELLPEAHVEEAEGGALSRPDIAAGVVRGITAEAAVSAAGPGQAAGPATGAN